MDWQRQGLGRVQAVERATSEYEIDSDPLSAFLGECTESVPAETVAAAALYGRYKGWAASNGEKAETGTAFGRHLKARGIGKLHDRGGWRYIGLRLMPLCDECDEL